MPVPLVDNSVHDHSISSQYCSKSDDATLSYVSDSPNINYSGNMNIFKGFSVIQEVSNIFMPHTFNPEISIGQSRSN